MTLVLDVPPGLEVTLYSNAQARGVTVEQYVLALVERETSLPAPPPGSEKWTLQDALDYAGPPPDNLGAACARASQDVLQRLWNNPEDDAARAAS